MSGLVETCVVIITVAIATIAIVLVRMTGRFKTAADEFERTMESVRISLSDVQDATRRVRDLTASLETVVPPLRRAAERVEKVGGRAAQLSNSLLDDVENPLRTTRALLSGVRAGARTLMYALTGTVGRNGARDHETEGGRSDAAS